MTFRLLVTAFTAGSITGSLRFGFLDADADAAANGLDFAVLAAVNLSSLRSVVADVAGVAPAVVGSPPIILPPRVSVILTTAVGTTLTYEIYAAGVYYP